MSISTKVIAFDVFGTVFDLSGVDRQEVRDYVACIKRVPWEPLSLPDHWATLPAHADSAAGIERLRKKFIVVTCSNGPMSLLTRLSKHNGINWDAIIPLEAARVYKTNPAAYLSVCGLLRVAAEEVMMVTANEKFGDLEAAEALGMKAVLIRGQSSIADIGALADRLGC